MKSDTIKKRLESKFYVATRDSKLERFSKQFTNLQDAYKYALKRALIEDLIEVELIIDIENNSEDEYNVVASETIYIKGY